MNRINRIKCILLAAIYVSWLAAAPRTPRAVAVIGTGYVGLVLGACLSDFGHHVVCVDVDEHKVRSLKLGILTIHEPGLAELVKKNVAANRLLFTSDIEGAIQAADIVFIAVGTPMSATGKADITAVETVAKAIGKILIDIK